jgi:hypothetical protein
LIDIINEIIREVQGNYVHLFQEKMTHLFPVIWQKTKNNERGQNKQAMIRLIKIILTWSLFFDEKVLNQIKETINFSEQEPLLSEEDKSKVSDFLRGFKPKTKGFHLPREVLE